MHSHRTPSFPKPGCDTKSQSYGGGYRSINRPDRIDSCIDTQFWQIANLRPCPGAFYNSPPPPSGTVFHSLSRSILASPTNFYTNIQPSIQSNTHSPSNPSCAHPSSLHTTHHLLIVCDSLALAWVGPGFVVSTCSPTNCRRSEGPSSLLIYLICQQVHGRAGRGEPRSQRETTLARVSLHS